jgi:transglutaminase-like putative cysteine protease
MSAVLDPPRPAARPPEPRRPAPEAATVPGRLAGHLRLAVLAGAATLLTSTGLTRVFEGFAWWFLPAVGAVVAAGLSGLLARALRVPLVGLPLVYLLGLALYVPQLSAPATTLGPLPTTATWTALTDLLGVGAEDVRRLAVPVPARPGLVLLVVLGTYAVACAVDAICTRLRSPATAGLPLLALIAVPAAIVPGDVGVLPFLAAAVGYLLLLAADGRRLRSGSPLGPPGGHSPGVVRIAVLGLVAAVAVPALLPDPGNGLFTPDETNGSSALGAGNGRARVVQPFVTLDQQLRSDEIVDLLKVRTDTPEYLRLTALELFDGTRFSLGRLQADPSARVTNGLPSARDVPASTAAGEVRVVDAYRQRYLPVPFSPTTIAVDGDWRLSAATSTVFSGRTDTGGIRYRYTAAVPTPTAQQLREEPPPVSVPDEVSVDRRLTGVSRDVLRLARDLTRSEPTTYDKIAAIQEYLRSPLFTYDLNGAPRNDGDPLRTFLLVTRRGYCEQFASAMAVLARAIGVPARVAIGFTPGTRDADGNWVITNRDAHAWPEIWFPTAGWVRFEPTPRDDSTEIPPDYSVPPLPGSVGVEQGGPSSREEGPVRGSSLDTGAVPGEGPGPLAPVAAPENASSSTSSALLTRGVPGLVLLVLVAPALARVLRRRRRLAGGAAGAWAEVADTATDLGVGAHPHESPRAAAARWRHRIGDVGADHGAGDALTRLLVAEERARFARGGATRTGAGDQERAADGLRVLRSLERASGRRARLRARLVPRSVLTATTALATATRQRLGGGIERWRGRMRPRRRTGDGV